MPDMDGFQVAELLRRAQKTKDIPIIFITAISREYQYREKGYDLGASSYLMKPIDPNELRKKIAYALKLRKLDMMTKNLK
jgi:CheY-like chemotaxis protein